MQLDPLNPGDYVRIKHIRIKPRDDKPKHYEIDQGIVISSEANNFMGNQTCYDCTILSGKTQGLVSYSLEFPQVAEVIHEAR